MNSDPTSGKVLVAVDASATLFGAPVATVAPTPDDDADLLVGWGGDGGVGTEVALP